MKVLIAGDFCPQYRVAELFDNGSYDSVLGAVKPYTEQADYSIVNFECPVTLGIEGETPIVKIGPSLCCSRKGVDAIKWAGFDCVTLANNHFYDYGENGVKQTVSACIDEGIDIVGGGINIERASAVLYKNIEGKTLAIINCCEHEFSIATDTKGGSNPLNPVQQYYAIQGARKKANYVLVIVHGGHEMFQLPSLRMQETYRFFVDAGADAVVNHHQHCYSGYEVYQGKPIIYGLGNFCFDEKGSTGGIWNEGYLLILSFDESCSFKIIPYNQCDKEPSVVLLPEGSFDVKLNEFNAIIQKKELLVEHVNRYYDSCNKQSSYIFEPLMNRVYTSLRYRNIMPSMVSDKRKILAFDFISCESHRDRIIRYLSDYNN